MEWILITAAVIIFFIIGRYTRNKYIGTKTGLLIFFLIFLALIITFTINLINHFTYVKLLLLAMIVILGFLDYYKKYKNLNSVQP